MGQLEHIKAIEKRLWTAADTLRPQAQFDYLVGLPDSEDRAKATIEAMESIEADYVMAIPPFNVDEIDADKVKRDPRLPFGLPDEWGNLRMRAKRRWSGVESK